MRRQSRDLWFTHPGLTGLVSVVVLTFNLMASVHSQIGQNSSVSLPMRIPNGDSQICGVVDALQGPLVLFTTQATNLGGPPGLYEIKNDGTIEHLQLPPGHRVRGPVRPALLDGNRYYIAAHLQDNQRNNKIAIGERGEAGLQWRLYPVDGQISGLSPSSSGIYYVKATANFFELWLISFTPQGDVPQIIKQLRRPRPGSGSVILTASWSGGEVAVAIGDSATNTRETYFFSLTPNGVRETRVPEAYLISECGTSAVSTEGKLVFFVTSPTGIDVIPVERLPLPGNPVVLQYTEGKVVYVDLSQQPAQLRVLDIQERTDRPIARLRSGNPLLDIPQVIGLRTVTGKDVYYSNPDDSTGGETPYDRNRREDIFRYNIVSGSKSGITIGPQPLQGTSYGLAIGHSSELVAFASDAPLVPGKTTPYHDVFVNDGGRLVRVLGQNGAEPNGSSFGDVAVPRYAGAPVEVVFASTASNLVANDNDGQGVDIFRWSPARGVECLSCDLDGDSFGPAVAPNGTVYFVSTTTFLGASTPQVYRWRNGSLSWVGQGLFDSVERVVVSPSGEYVVITARRSEDRALGVYVFSEEGELLRSLERSQDIHATDVSNYGDVVVQTSAPLSEEDADELDDVYVWRADGSLMLASRNPSGAKANAPSAEGRIDASGRYVSFVSQASNLVPMDLNSSDDVYILDMERGSIYCASRDPQTYLPVGGSNARIAANGTAVVFTTGSPELVWMPFSSGVFVAKHEIGCTPSGDVNLDGVVDDADLLIVLFNFGAQGELFADLNVDGTVDDSDLLAVLFNFGASCGFFWAGGNENEKSNDSAPYLVRSGAGRAVLYFPAATKFYQLVGPTIQKAELDAALYGQSAPYPVIGGIFNPWREVFGSFLSWSPEDIRAFREYIDPQHDGDFLPASGSNTYTWAPGSYGWQPRHDTYIWFRPSLQFTAGSFSNNCVDYVSAHGRAIVDLKVFGLGRNEFAKFEAFGFAGSPNQGSSPYASYRVEAFFNGRSVWSRSDSKSIPPSGGWQHNHTIPERTLLSARKTVVLKGIPIELSLEVTGAATVDLELAYQLGQQHAVAMNFTPSGTANLRASAGIASIPVINVRAPLSITVGLNPLVNLRLPSSVVAYAETRSGGGCDLVAQCVVNLAMTALGGYLDIAYDLGELGGPLCLLCVGKRSGYALVTVDGVSLAHCCTACRVAGRKVCPRATIRLLQWNGVRYNTNLLNRTLRWRLW